MDLQSAHALYWFSKDTIQVRIAAVFVSLSPPPLRQPVVGSSRRFATARVRLRREELYDIVK